MTTPAPDRLSMHSFGTGNGRPGLWAAPGDGDLLRQPLLNAAVIALGFALLGTAYILVSDSVATTLAPDKEALARIQEAKGIAFIATMALLLFGFSFLLFRRVYRGAQGAMQAQRALLDAERRASAAVVSLSMAHDINNQLQVQRSIAYLLGGAAHLQGEEAQRLLGSLEESIGKLEAMLAAMRAGGRRSALTALEPVELEPFVQESLRFLHLHERVRGCRLSVVAHALPSLTVCPGVLHDALLNLVLNAGDALEGSGDIRVELRAGAGGGRDGAVIEVHDSGPGVPPAMKARLFQPFHTTKAHGTGLGLLAVKACAELHGGTVSYHASPLGGACFRMSLRSAEGGPAA
jgi:signal transduction histidine kinase